MKNILFSLMVVATLNGVALADASLTLEGVHNCCKGCENGITKAVESVRGATAEVVGGKVTITAKNSATATKAYEALLDAGYTGKGEGAQVPKSATSDRKLSGTVTVAGTHLCCGKCVRAVEAAVAKVPGITSANIESKAKTFTVEGEFKEGDLIAALNNVGFHGTIK